MPLIFIKILLNPATRSYAVVFIYLKKITTNNFPFAFGMVFMFYYLLVHI